jgi:hypothetical protein
MKKLGDKIIKNFDGANAPDDFNIPSMGIEDIDRAIFKLFDKQLSFEVNHNGTMQKVPVIFAAGERFALTRRKNPIRDRNNALILPVISIMRNNIDFSPSQSGKGTAISFREQTNYIVKYRLSEKDRKYQNIINKLGLKSQDNVASLNNLLENSGLTGGYSSKPGTVASRREDSGGLSYSQNSKVALNENLGKNIFEILEIPYPEFITVSYDVVFWTQYMKQANNMMETLIMNFSGQGEEIAIKTESGYELVAFFGSPFTSNSNFDDFSDSERVVKHSFNVTIPGYIINPKNPGLPNLIRSYLSAPEVNFSYSDANAKIIDYQPETKEEKIKRHVLTDLTNPSENEMKRGESREVLESVIENPFTKSTKTQFSKVKLRNARSGETVASGHIVKELE